MKILILTDAWHPQVNGVVRTYEHLKEELEKLGHEIKVIGPEDFPRTIPVPFYKEIKLAILPQRRLKKMVEEFQPDAIHIATEGPIGWSGRKYCMTYTIPFTTSYHTHFPDYLAERVAKFLPFLRTPTKKLAIHVIRRFHQPAEIILIATQSLENQLREWQFKNKIRRLTRGVKLDQFSPHGEKIFEKIQKPIALYVGRIALEKNIESFLSMNWSGTKVIVGKGPDMEALKSKYPEAIFCGVQVGEDLAKHYRSSDIFVFPSKTDTFGIVIIEALASGLPVAAYPVTGPIDILDDKTLGSMQEDLAEAALLALKHGKPDVCAKHVQENYTWQKAAQQFLDATIEAHQDNIK